MQRSHLCHTYEEARYKACSVSHLPEPAMAEFEKDWQFQFWEMRPTVKPTKRNPVTEEYGSRRWREVLAVAGLRYTRVRPLLFEAPTRYDVRRNQKPCLLVLPVRVRCRDVPFPRPFTNDSVQESRSQRVEFRRVVAVEKRPAP